MNRVWLAVRRAIGHERVKWMAVVLYAQGHRKAARMARGWHADCPTTAELTRVRRTLLLRYPGR